MFFHEETDIEKISTKVTVDWNITAETLDEPDKLSESYQAILSFQDFTDFFDDLKEKQRKVMQAHSLTAENQKYLGEFTTPHSIYPITNIFYRFESSNEMYTHQQYSTLIFQR